MNEKRVKLLGSSQRNPARVVVSIAGRAVGDNRLTCGNGVVHLTMTGEL